MNGVHDMGGMHGFGPVDVDDDVEFHDDWERTVFAIDKLLKFQSTYTIDEKRQTIERIDPVEYLEMSYFERWAAAVETLLIERGEITEAELESEIDASAEAASETRDDENGLVELARERYESEASFDREPVEALFEPGAEVAVRNDHPAHHTRCPRYVRRSRGVIDRVHGTYVVPDDIVVGEETAEPLYSVRFDAAELWSEDTDADAVYVDLWERYLIPPDESDGAGAAGASEAR